MEAPKRPNYPYLITRDTSHSRANLEVFRFSPSDRCPATAACLASTQALRSRHVSSASKLLGACDQGGQTAPWAVRLAQAVWPALLGGWTGLGGRTSSSSLRPRFCGSTEYPSGFLVNHCKPRELGVASANRHSWLGSHVVPARPWYWGSTKKPSTTSSCCSCHHAVCTWPRWPPGPSN
jgi:hypothetical protein